MGRWAQRARGGSGPGNTALIRIVVAAQLSAMQLDLVYDANVNAGDFDPNTFASSPSGAHGNTVNQVGPTELSIDLDADASGDDEVQYTGVVSGVLTPQSVQYT